MLSKFWLAKKLLETKPFTQSPVNTHRVDKVVAGDDAKLEGEAARDDGGVDGGGAVRVKVDAAVPWNVS